MPAVSMRFLRHVHMHVRDAIESVALNNATACALVGHIAYHLRVVEDMMQTIEGLYLE